MTTKDDIEQLFRTNYAAMYRLAMLLLRDDEAAKDIVHYAFEALLVSGKSEVSDSYLLTAVRKRCLKHIRRLSVQERFKAVYSVEEPLKPIARKIAEYYGYQIEFNNEVSKSLRLYFRWNKEITVEEIVACLDNFEQIRIEIKDNTIKID